MRVAVDVERVATQCYSVPNYIDFEQINISLTPQYRCFLFEEYCSFSKVTISGQINYSFVILSTSANTKPNAPKGNVDWKLVSTFRQVRYYWPCLSASSGAKS